MSLQDSVKETIREFEKNLPPIHLKKLEKVHKKFETMILKGLITRPTYDLAPRGTLFTDISKL